MNAPTDNSPPQEAQWDSPNSTRINIPSHEFENIVPFYSRLLGYNPVAAMISSADVLANLSYRAGRHITQPEADAATHHLAQAYGTLATYQPPLTIGLTWLSMRRTRAKFGFPFYKPPKGVFNPRVFLSQKMLFFRGPQAVKAWHALRGGAWFLWWLAVCHTTLKAVAMGVATDRIIKDEQTKQLMQDVRDNAETIRREQQAHGHRPHQTLPHRPPVARNVPRQEDASEAMSQVQMSERPVEEEQQQSYSQQAQPRHQASRPGPRPWGRPAPKDVDEEEADLWDDASPVAQTAQGKYRTTPSRQTQQGSAWERLRNRPAAGTNYGSESSGSGFEQRDSSENRQFSRDDAYAKPEDNRSREQAQREFDALLDKERRGESDGSGRGSSRRW